MLRPVGELFMIKTYVGMLALPIFAILVFGVQNIKYMKTLRFLGFNKVKNVYALPQKWATIKANLEEKSKKTILTISMANISAENVVNEIAKNGDSLGEQWVETKNKQYGIIRQKQTELTTLAIQVNEAIARIELLAVQNDDATNAKKIEVLLRRVQQGEKREL
jgi:hypothetical protein